LVERLLQEVTGQAGTQPSPIFAVTTQPISIGVASYGALGHVPLRFTTICFSVYFDLYKV